MITLKRCATCWKKICATFKEFRFDGTPKETIDKILEQMTFEEARTTFAVVAALKRHDGRIWGYNREWMKATKKEKELLTDTAIAALFAFRYSGEKRGVLDMCEFYIMRCIKDCNTYDTIYTPLRNIIGWDD